MSELYPPDVTDKFSTHLIRHTALTLVEEGTFPPAELRDVMQQLRLGLLAQTDTFDPSRARWSTFVKTVVRSTSISLRRRQDAQCRQAAGGVQSLNVLIQDECGELVELGATVGEEEHRTGVGMDFICHTEQIDVEIDVQHVLSRLPAELREICERLKSHSIAEVSRELGLSRNTLARRLAELRVFFVAAGLAEDA